MKKTQVLAALCCAAAALGLGAMEGAAAAETGAGQAASQAQPQRQPIPLSLSRVAKVRGVEGVYIFDCNPENIYDQSHIPGSIHINVEHWERLLPKDKKNSFLIFYCINRLCNVSWEASQYAISLGYENVYQMPDGIQGWVQNGYEFEGAGRRDPALSKALEDNK